MNLTCHELGVPKQLTWFTSLGQLGFVVDLSIVNGVYQPTCNWGTLPYFGFYTGKICIIVISCLGFLISC